MFRPVLRRAALVALVALTLVALPTPVQAVTGANSILVDISSDTNAADGHCSLREAVTNALTNTRVRPGVGECGVGRADVEDVVRWTFADPFSSLATPLPTITGTDPLRLAGEPSISSPNPIITGGGTTRLITVDGGDLTLEKVTLAGAAGGTGSALDLVSGQVHLVQANIAANSGTGPGAIVRAAAGTILVTETTTFVNNTVTGAGGTVLDAAGELTMTGGRLTLTNGSGAAGGISATGATVTITDFELSDNDGTGLSFSGGTTAALERVDLIRNVATASCGGLSSDESTLTWTGGQVFGNETGGDGGGVCLVSADGTGSSRLSRVSITNNHAVSGSGGGVLVSASDVEMGNVTISENTAAEASAMLMRPNGLRPAGVLLANVTVADNINEQLSGTAAVIVGDESDLVTSNTIIGRNAPADLDTLANATATHDHGIVSVDLTDIIAPLGPNGGQPTYLTNRLLATGSLAIDHGSAATCQLAIVGLVDARGFARPADACDIGAVERDLAVPSASGALLVLATSHSLSGGAVVGRLTWTGSDTGSGVRGYRVQGRVNGGAWIDYVFTKAKSQSPSLTSGDTFQFRVRAEDNDGNVSPWSMTGTYTAKLVQQTSSAVTWTGTWSTASSGLLSGGSDRWSTKLGSSATLTAKARRYALVSMKAPGRGKAKIYVNGVLKATVDLSAPSTTYRSQVWSISFTTAQTRTIKVVVLATSGRPRVDVDAFSLLV